MHRYKAANTMECGAKQWAYRSVSSRGSEPVWRCLEEAPTTQKSQLQRLRTSVEMSGGSTNCRLCGQWNLQGATQWCWQGFPYGIEESDDKTQIVIDHIVMVPATTMAVETSLNEWILTPTREPRALYKMRCSA